VNRIIFLISFSTSSLLVYRRATDFSVLIFYLATLPEVIIRSKTFLVESLWTFKNRIISSANKDNLIYSFPVCIPFVSFFCFISLTRNYSNILNKNGESGHPCLNSGFRRIFSVFPYIGYRLSDTLYLVEVYSLYS
jgi:hypothetical protein